MLTTFNFAARCSGAVLLALAGAGLAPPAWAAPAAATTAPAAVAGQAAATAPAVVAGRTAGTAPAAAPGVRIVAVVNGAPITNVDVDNRARLFA
ncbi:MAG: hypothetical protein ACREFY_15730, partial [Acetobacteraceae bacterium]